MNLNRSGFHGIYTGPEASAERLDKTAGFVYQCQTLARKLGGAIEKPDEVVELEVKELVLLGDSLFSLGNLAYPRALAAIDDDYGFITPGSRLSAQLKITQYADEAYGLFKELEPIARSKAQIGWMTWNHQPSFGA